ncbi:hypothetical protein E2562_026160 [Oryza meyeriana var. granulata]|uniref:AT-hook motif nuclear-localized protein n=1 Tax=Oryza meyeriana var. granulata TaxID=110450 RepID=A0A6G1E2R1_9ORYZ|nr:hypothetical protein E2562_026160 [Oryza meyeriana var. granulata]
MVTWSGTSAWLVFSKIRRSSSGGQMEAYPESSKPHLVVIVVACMVGLCRCGGGMVVVVTSSGTRWGSRWIKRRSSELGGDMVACSAGANFTPHIITVAPGEDVTMKVISFSQQGPRAICILSANGVISNVTLRQPDSSGGTLTYEGRFELLSLSGSFMPTENSGTRSRSGGMSVSLASPDGRVVGGGVAGLLVAASPVQIVVGSFLPSYQMEQKNKKPRVEAAPALAQTPPAVPISSTDTHSSEQGQHSSVAPRANIVTSAYSADQSWGASPAQSIPDSARTPSGDVKVTASGA